MPIDPNLNPILKEMWRLDEKMAAGEPLSREEKEFFNQHLAIIAEYYEKNDHYWNEKKPLD